MQYTATSIANQALQRIGAVGNIQSITDGSANATRVNTVWNSIFQECLSERDWKFAKTKVNLQMLAVKPVFGYCFAYALPADFLRLVKPKEIPQEQRITNASWYGQGWGGGGNGWWNNFQSDVPVWPRYAAPYIVETVLIPQTPAPQNPTYQLCLLTNYNSTQPTNPPPPPNQCPVPLGITYIRIITDYTQLMPGFVNALTYRLAAELAVAITEDQKKAETMMQMYLSTLNGAQAQTEVDDSLAAEAGNFNWIEAGRYRYWGGR